MKDEGRAAFGREKESHTSKNASDSLQKKSYDPWLCVYIFNTYIIFVDKIATIILN